MLRAVLVFLEKTRQKFRVLQSISFFLIKIFDFQDHHPISERFIERFIDISDQIKKLYELKRRD